MANSSGGEVLTHFELYDGLYDLTFGGALYLNTPAFQDMNGNGSDDFFEASQSAGGSGSGVFFLDAGGSGSAQAQWSRSAGSSFGTCTLNLQGFGPFTHTFQLMEYTGTLTYTPGSNTVSGILNVDQTDQPGSLLRGPVQFTKVSTNRFNQLTLTSVVLTNEASQTLYLYSPGTVVRTSTWPANYHGDFEFVDGDLNTADEDYYFWALSIDDSNDADADGIPDFSDDPSLALPRQPTLSLTHGPTSFLLTINGDIGRQHEVQMVTALAGSDWVTVLSTNLTSDPLTVALPVPAENATFWRVSAK